MADRPPRRAVWPASLAQRRQRQAPRQNRITVRFSDDEYRQVLANAAAVRLAAAAWIATAALVPPAASGPGPVPGGSRPRSSPNQELLDELAALRRQLRGACTLLNQAVAKLHSIGRPVGELPAVAAHVLRVAAVVEAAAAAVRDSR